MPQPRNRRSRPLRKPADPDAPGRRRLAAREPIYALADITLISRDDPHEVVIEDAVAALDRRLRQEGKE